MNADQENFVRIQVIGGTYCGQCGWMDTNLKQPRKSYHVILEDSEGNHFQKCLRRHNIKVSANTPEPKNYFEAALAQYPKINCEVDKLTETLATLRLSVNEDLIKVLHGKLKEAEEKVKAEGRYRHVSWPNV
jgi:hypothetical protein